MAAAAAAGIGQHRIRVHVPFAGGSFGLHSTSGRDRYLTRATMIDHPMRGSR
jgi:hypothetical protein